MGGSGFFFYIATEDDGYSQQRLFNGKCLKALMDTIWVGAYYWVDIIKIDKLMVALVGML